MDHSAHGHGCHQPPTKFNRSFAIAVSANGIFTLIQIIVAFYAYSTSLLADAFHNLGDVFSLILAWVAMSLMNRQPTQKSSYGLKKVSILAALANGILLTFTCGIIFTEALYKFSNPEPMAVGPVMLAAFLGILVNGGTAVLFMRDSGDLNIRGAFLHLFYDALISAGVVLSALLIYLTGWLWLDPLVGVLIAVIILRGTWSLFRDSLRLIIDLVPSNISLIAIKEFLMSQTGVEALHDLHVWALSTQENALSVHLYMPKHPFTDEERLKLVYALKEEFPVHHITIQIESKAGTCDEVCNKDYC